MEIKIVIKGAKSEKEHILLSDTPIIFVDAMEQLGLTFYRPCGGVGRCKSCGIRFSFGMPQVTSEDEEAFDFNEIRSGWRLGCKCIITRSCKIEVPISLAGEITSVLAEEVLSEDDGEVTDIGLAVDIGSTTIAAAFINLKTGKIIKQRNITNSQIKYGSDVISRIKAAIDDGVENLEKCVHQDLQRLVTDSGIDEDTIKRAICSGNTVMTHLFLGYNVDGFAAYPFVPYTLDSVSFVERKIDFYFMPAIAPFIGGDIVAGLYYINKKILKEKRSKDSFILVDLGTNAEIVLFYKDRYYCASASAGPALEGASLACGTAAVRGAINHLIINDGKCSYTTIGGEAPVGLCGSGVVDLIYELHRNGIIDNGGLLLDEYHDNGFPITDKIAITGDDIQQVLLAKSAICTAITLIIKRAGCDIDGISHLFISGGLGATVSVHAAAGIGLFPRQLSGRFEAVGNTSLLGAIAFMSDGDEKALADIRAKASVLELNMDDEFEKSFLNFLSIDN